MDGARQQAWQAPEQEESWAGVPWAWWSAGCAWPAMASCGIAAKAASAWGALWQPA